MRRDLQGYHARDVLERVIRDAPAEHHLDRVQYADMKTYLPGDILAKVDRASMATSLEVRVPLPDHEFLEWAEIGRASCRERVSVSVDLGGRRSIKKKKKD